MNYEILMKRALGDNEEIELKYSNAHFKNLLDAEDGYKCDFLPTYEKQFEEIKSNLIKALRKLKINGPRDKYKRRIEYALNAKVLLLIIDELIELTQYMLTNSPTLSQSPQV